ncbi:serine/threonine-protein kinase RsbW [Roseibium hamelinense]|uniref:Serine/threonine-protein kinase RsbW n=1 Tax=Roseibium hamelinense TaxID=150831 RepID=A0A562SG56_9HYPH|nr:ATP-binding protein [Roseibium hamelinense]MTI42582.1 ATP-binding protein [Roseibium hamelinense]TWI79540.1 serine/threonine-protein kinase RsbW [Roseibium hamelinense]
MHLKAEQVEVLNEVSSLNQLYDFIDAFALRAGLADDARRTVSVVVEELFANTVSYGYPTGSPDQIILRLSLTGDKIEICLTDHGIPFDTAASTATDFEGQSTEDRRVGGLGLFLVHQLSETVSSHHHNGTNFTQIVVSRSKTDMSG